MNRFKKLLMLDLPIVVGSVDDTIDHEFAGKALQSGLDVVEARIDRFRNTEPSAVAAVLAKLSSMVTLGTVRPQFEGGEWAGTEGARLAVFKHMMPLVDAIDIELAADEILAEVVSSAKQAGLVVIVSHHDFGKTPSKAELVDLVAKAAAAGADLIKISTFAQTQRDLRRLTEFVAEYSGTNLIVIAMGTTGLPSRILFPFLGSRLTYCDLGMGNAPGQLPFKTVSEMLKILSPAYNESKSTSN